MKRGKLREEAIERGKEKLKDVEMDWWIELRRLVNFPRLDSSPRRIRMRKRTATKSDLVTFFPSIVRSTRAPEVWKEQIEKSQGMFRHWIRLRFPFRQDVLPTHHNTVYEDEIPTGFI